MNFLHACFVTALRSIPLFPRMLILAWASSQLPGLQEPVTRSLTNFLSTM
jgi:hypothetical protein